MAPVKVYGMPVSTCTRRIIATLLEKNVEYELVTVDLMKGEHKSPEHLKLQVSRGLKYAFWHWPRDFFGYAHITALNADLICSRNFN